MPLKLSISLLLLYGTLNIQGQEIRAFNRKLNFIFYGIDNPIFISGICDCDSIIVKTSNGSITQVGDCQYILNSKRPGNTFITVYKIEYRDTVEISNDEFRVRDFPDVEACINNKRNCSVVKDFLINSKRLTAPVDNWDISLEYPVQSFELVIFREDEILFKRSYFESKFPEELINEFQKLEKGDIVFFYNIIVKNVIDLKRELSPIRFNIN